MSGLLCFPRGLRSRRGAAIALLSASLLGGAVELPLHAAVPVEVAERQGEWDAELRLGRLTKDGTVTDLVLQLNVADKPETPYANAVYQVFALRDGQRYLVYNSRGARLLSREAGAIAVRPEPVAIANLYTIMGSGTNLRDVELEAIVTIRYDAGEVRDRSVTWTHTQHYRNIPEISGVAELAD